jgi:hypothetical protein
MFKNKKVNFSIPRLLIILLTLIPVVYNEIENHKTQVLYDALLYVPLYLFILVIYIIILIFDIVFYIDTKKIKSFIPSSLGLVFIITAISINKFHNYKLHQKTIYKAKSENIKDGEYETKYRIEFKEKGNYVVFETEIDGLVTNYYYGKYFKNDTVFELDNIIGKKKISKRLLIKLIKNKKSNNFEKQLVQIDNNGNYLKNKFNFKFTLK